MLLTGWRARHFPLLLYHFCFMYSDSKILWKIVFYSSTVVDSCLSNPCQHGGTCKAEEGGFVCTCPANYRGILCNGKYAAILFFSSNFSLKERLKVAGVYEPFFVNVCFVKTENAILPSPVKNIMIVLIMDNLFSAGFKSKTKNKL